MPQRHVDEKPNAEIPGWDVLCCAGLAAAVLLLLAHNHSSTSAIAKTFDEHGRLNHDHAQLRAAGLPAAASAHGRNNSSARHSLLPPPAQAGAKRPEDGYTLLVSFFATANPPGHYPELLGALRANIANPAVDEVAVLYEPLDGMGCADLLVTLSSRSIPGFDGGIGKSSGEEKLKCIPWTNGQPTYATLFEYASVQPNGYFRGATVIVANVDIVFDESLLSMPPVEHEVYVLSVNHAPDPATYEAATGKPLCGQATTRDDRCPWPGWKKANTRSWDAFVFRPPLPDGFADAAVAKGAPLDVVMNAVGAENRAKCGLEAAGLEVLNACMYVRTQHWHRCSQQMHSDAGKVDIHKECDGRTYPCMMYYYGPAATHVIDASKICRDWRAKQGMATLRGKAGQIKYDT